MEEKDKLWVYLATLGFFAFIAYLIYMDRQRAAQLALEQKLSTMSTLQSLRNKQRTVVSMSDGDSNSNICSKLPDNHWQNREAQIRYIKDTFGMM